MRTLIRTIITSCASLLLVFSIEGSSSGPGAAAVKGKQSGAEMEMAEEDIRPPGVAGQFYPADPKELEKQVEELLENAKIAEIYGEIVALISPHAGYEFSGQVAAHSYKQIKGKSYDAVIVIGFDHRPRARGISVRNRGGYRTPLGVVPVDVDLADAIISQDERIFTTARPRPEEHSLEVELPFLQKTVDQLRIVPIAMLADHSFDTCRRLAKAIASAAKGKKVLLVASSDLYHAPGYYGNWYDECVRTDSKTLGAIERFDPAELHEGLTTGRYQACGVGPIVTALLAAKEMGADKAKVIARTNSGDVTGRRKGYIVGYGAVVIYRSSSEGSSQKEKKAGIDMGLKPEEKEKLLEIARTTIEKRVRGEKVPDFEVQSEILSENRGAFVTINKKGQLRGCIGYIEAYKPLYVTVQEMAEAAALRDPRFPPVSEDELGDLEIEISVLTPLRRIEDIEGIEVGKHGIVIRRGYSQGVLLPQVAADFGWDRQTFLEHTCRKAGLPRDVWKDKDTEIWIFSADVFGEEQRMD